MGVTAWPPRRVTAGAGAITVRLDHLLELTSSGVDDAWRVEEREAAGREGDGEIEEEEKSIIVILKFRSCFFPNMWICFAKCGLKTGSSSIGRAVCRAEVEKMTSLTKWIRAKIMANYKLGHV